MLDLTPPELENIIQAGLKVTRAEAYLLMNGMYDALTYSESVGEVYSNSKTVKEYAAELQIAKNALSKLNKAIKSIGDDNRLALDTIYYAANSNDTMLMNMPLDAAASAFEVVAVKMERTIDFMMNDVANPGKGNARREGKKFIAGIEMLARHFSDVCPQYELSDSENSYFYKYVSLWLVHICKNDFVDVTRHIANTLNHPQARLHHSEKKKSL